ncbi:VanZ like family protein [Salegentibacter echinorum]|uniref:VanZ like family protein n=1 Tax=Salegentibacter echinorum TaxID=1073325 RepID=A0A1M5HAC2_SALEC|nr:teicoplanin resistance protein VanZ [Salegentibacter echinorum]SHG12925.1 VanZ like family protein [Salegentibacter echinorum]
MQKIIKNSWIAKTALGVASIYTIVLVLSSLVQLGKVSVGTFEPTDKLLHLAAYFGFVFLWKIFFILKTPANRGYKSNLFKLAGAAIVFGMLIEVLQGVLTSYREPDWLDALANSAGVLLAVFLFLILEKFFKRLNSKINLIF